MDHKMSNVQETKKLLSKQRRCYLVMIAAIALIGIGFLASTVVLAIRLQGAYPSVQVKYYVWNHYDASLGAKYDVELKVPENVTMFALLEHAERESPDRFRFNYTTLPFGRYVTSIGGVSEDEGSQTFWILYKVKDEPSAGRPPAQETAVEKGIDDLRVQDDEIYVFWLTKSDGYGQKRLEALSGHVNSVGACK